MYCLNYKMPFVNQQQRAICYIQKKKAEEAGRKPTWNCEQWEKETKTTLGRMYKCGAICKDGHRCTRMSTQKGRCWQHK